MFWDTWRKKNTAQGTTPFIVLKEIDYTSSPPLLLDPGLEGAGCGQSGTSKRGHRYMTEVKLKNLCSTRLLIFLSTSATSKYETLPIIYSKVMSMLTRPPEKKGHKHVSGHLTVCNLHSWPQGYLSIRLCENDCKGIANFCLSCCLSRE